MDHTRQMLMIQQRKALDEALQSDQVMLTDVIKTFNNSLQVQQAHQADIEHLNQTINGKVSDILERLTDLSSEMHTGQMLVTQQMVALNETLKSALRVSLNEVIARILNRIDQLEHIGYLFCSYWSFGKHSFSRSSSLL